MDAAADSDGEAPATRPREETTLPATATLSWWAAALFRYLAHSLSAVRRPWAAAADDLPAHADDGGHPKLFFTPDVASSPAGYFFSAWKPGGQIEKLPCAAGVLPEGALVSPVSQPLHGLVLLRCWPPPAGAGHFVCNPSTGALLPLPDSRVPRKMAGREYNPGTCYNHVCYGLGYSETTSEYKAVRLFCLRDRDGAVAATSCEILVLGASPDWRPAAGGRPPPRISFFRNSTSAAVFLHGAMHFLCDDSSITTFDVGDETFGSLPPPPGLEFAHLKLTVLDRRLCIHHESPDLTSGNPYCVWTLSDYEAGGRWELLCRIDATAWPDPMTQGCPFTPLYMYTVGREPKILFGTAASACRVFVSEASGGRRSSRPRVLFAPEEGAIGKCSGCRFLRVGLLEDSAVPVGRTSEEVVFSSPSATAWSEILKGLPARAVARLSLVCRDMRAMIQTGRFARLHAANANLNRSPRIMFMNNSLFRGEFVALETLVGSTSILLPPLTGGGCCSKAFCCNPCHGLNFVTCGSSHYVCNPITGSYQRIPPLIMENGGGVFVVAGHVGLGYDPVAEKHLLVRLTYWETYSECKVRYIGDYSWRTVDSSPPRQVHDAAPPVFANGKLYWMAVDSNKAEQARSQRCEIMAFDVLTTSFEVMQGPPLCSSLVDDDDNDGDRVSLLELQGELCVAHGMSNPNSIEVWAMKEKATWSLEYHIELERFSPEYLSSETTVLAVDPKDGRILLSTGRVLGYYNTSTAALETIYRLGSVPFGGGSGYRFTPALCHESFVCPFH